VQQILQHPSVYFRRKASEAARVKLANGADERVIVERVADRDGGGGRVVAGAGEVNVVDADHERALGFEAVAGRPAADGDGTELGVVVSRPGGPECYFTAPTRVGARAMFRAGW
jgi:hypothetical protein